MSPGRDRRPGALGYFSPLPDELLCAIIGSLPPRSVGNLACVSSVFYILCNEEPLWMHLCLDQHRGGFVEFESSWRQSALLMLGYVKKGTAVVKPPMCFDGFSSMFLYKRWYRCHIALEGFALDTGVIDRRENISLKEFRATYDGKKPVLITDLTTDWPAKSWNLSQLVESYGDVAFKVSQSHGKKIKMKLKDYASYMACQHDEEPLYIFDAKAPKMLEEYKVPSLFSEDLLSVLDKSVRPPFRWLVAGPSRSGASWHVDPALTSAWNTLLSGRKRWALYPPGRVPPSVMVHVDEDDGSVNFDGPTSLQWWLDVYPTLQEEDKPLECTQMPGETISVPSGWWHCVLNIDDSIAVTQNYVNSINLELVCLDMAPGFHHRGIARAGHLAIEESLQRTAKVVPDSATLEEHVQEADAKGQHDGHSTHNPSDPESYSLYIDVDNLAMYTEKQSNHFISSTSKGGYLDRGELRDWLRRLWKLRPDLHKRLWKCACIAIDAESWLQRVMAICKAHGLPIPIDEEQLPFGNGSNPVYLFGDYVIKLCVEEDGPMVAAEGLHSELQFYALVNNSGSNLCNTIPSLVASGFVIPDGEAYKVIPWDGSGECPGVLHSQSQGKKRQRDDLDESRSQTNHSDVKFARDSIDQYQSTNLFNSELKEGGKENPVVKEDPVFWPFIVQKRCEGTNLDSVMEKMTREDSIALASFLGEQLRLLHSLPLPATFSRTTWTQKTTKLAGREPRCKNPSYGQQNVADGSTLMHPHDLTNSSNGVVATENGIQRECYIDHVKEDVQSASCEVPPEWHYFVGLMRQQRANVLERFEDWGSLPTKLQDQLDTYLPKDPAVLVGLQKDGNRLAESMQPPVWLHMDIMTDNLQMAEYLGDDHVNESVDLDLVMCSSNGIPTCKQEQEIFTGVRSCKKDSQNCEEMHELRALQARYILDFGDVAYGDPLYEFLAIHVSVFKLDPFLLKVALKSYGLPLTVHKGTSNGSDGQGPAPSLVLDVTRPSYRAMCYCLLHEHNAMGAILKQQKDCRTAESFEEVEEKLWWVLNEWDPQCP